MKLKSKKPEVISEAGLALLKARHEQLSFLKKQQWTITNYVALIYGALFSAKHFAHSSIPHQDSWLKFFAVLAGVVSVVLVMIVQRHIGDLRVEIDRANDWIFGEFKEGEETERGKIVGQSTGTKGSCRDLPFLSALLLVIIGGLGLLIRFI